MSFEIDFEPIGRRVRCETGATILDAAQRAGVMLAAVCGGDGSCGRCIVRVMDGQVSPPNDNEEEALGRDDVAAGWRLACQTHIASDVRVHVPPDSLVTAQRTQTEGQGRPTELAPAVRALPADLTPPTLADLRADAARVRDALSWPALEFDTHVLRQLSPDLRAVDFHPAVFVRRATVVGVRPARTAPLGLAVDLGTTKLAAYLVDLATGETLAAAGAMNPQIAFGEDVMARISHTVDHADGGEQLRTAIVDALNGLARDLCTQTGRATLDIADAVIVGNTAMHHLCLGLPVKQLGLAPYVAAESAALDVASHDMGLSLAPGASVHWLPNIAGFVGADHVAMLLATGLHEHTGVALAMDIGTNTEISLVARGRHLACSTASGPAFEGAHIHFGMRAAPGAIEEVLIRDGRVQIKTVGDQPPVGLCGSGILDLVAQMRRAGIIDRRGMMPLTNGHARVRRGEHGPEFVVATPAESGGPEITFSRNDVSEIQLAKGAMRAGVNIMLQRAGVTETDLDEVIIAGAFGTYLDVQSGIDIGMFPRIDRHRFKQVGNAAGAGARMALLSTVQREHAKRLVEHVEYVELTTEKEFSSKFARGLLVE
jgi:uncharacterized 2Fe-2S/4Fe-4S cluster protein (DUF4445 family)